MGRSLHIEPACPGHGSFWRRIFPRPVLTDEHRFVTIQWNALFSHFVLYSGIIQSGDENASHRLSGVKIFIFFCLWRAECSGLCWCNSCQLQAWGKNSVAFNLLLSGDFGFGMAVSPAPQFLAHISRLQTKRVLDYMGSHFCHLAEHSNFIA